MQYEVTSKRLLTLYKGKPYFTLILLACCVVHWSHKHGFHLPTRWGTRGACGTPNQGVGRRELAAAKHAKYVTQLGTNKCCSPAQTRTTPTKTRPRTHHEYPPTICYQKPDLNYEIMPLLAPHTPISRPRAAGPHTATWTTLRTAPTPTVTEPTAARPLPRLVPSPCASQRPAGPKHAA